jgi:hypothetical protein
MPIRPRSGDDRSCQKVVLELFPRRLAALKLKTWQPGGCATPTSRVSNCSRLAGGVHSLKYQQHRVPVLDA